MKDIPLTIDPESELDYWEKALSETQNAIKKFESALKFEKAVESMLKAKVDGELKEEAKDLNKDL